MVHCIFFSSQFSVLGTRTGTTSLNVQTFHLLYQGQIESDIRMGNLFTSVTRTPEILHSPTHVQNVKREYWSVKRTILERESPRRSHRGTDRREQYDNYLDLRSRCTDGEGLYGYPRLKHDNFYLSTKRESVVYRIFHLQTPRRPSEPVSCIPRH